MMVGISGSGKTTYAMDTFPGHVRVSLDRNKKDMPLAERRRLARRYDDKRPLSLTGGSDDRKAEYVQIGDALKEGTDVVVDDTSLTREIRMPYIVLARKRGAGIRAVYFADIARAYAQNAGRKDKSNEDVLPDHVLDIQRAKMEKPALEEGFDYIQVVD